MAGPARLTPTGLQPGSAESFSNFVLGAPAAKTPLTSEVVPVIQNGVTVRAPFNNFGGVGATVAAYGGVPGANAATNTSAFINAQASNSTFFVPPGTYATSMVLGTDYDTETKNTGWFGTGAIVQTSDGSQSLNLPGYYREISIAPALNGADYLGFGGDPSNVLYPGLVLLNGTNTAGAPTTGYFINDNISALHINYNNSNSGHNQQTSGNDGRTGIWASNWQFSHGGNGDMAAFFVSGLVTGSRAGATTWLASPGIQMLGGELQAFVAGCSIEALGDLDLVDNGFDVTGIGANINFTRTNNTGALDTFWGGYRVQSIGSKAIDHAFFGKGPMVVGLDLTAATFDTNLAGITLPGNGKIYLNASTSDNFRTTSFGSVFIQYNVSGSEIQFGHSGSIPFVIGNNFAEFVSTCTFATPFLIPISSTPSTPPAGFGFLYFKSDNLLYSITPDGIERKIGSE